MELLLILSALLSAATGALTGARAPDAATRHEAAAEAVAIAEAAVAVVAPMAVRTTAEPVERDRSAPAPRAAPPSAAALDTDRLIE